MRMLGWIALSDSSCSTNAVARHVLPPSVLRSKYTRQPSALLSMLLGERMSPLLSRTGLFLIGPRIPSGRRIASLHVAPLSSLVFTTPHHVLGLWPTL